MSRIEGLDAVYRAETMLDERLHARVRRRACDHGAQFFWYLAFDDRIYFVATKPLPGDAKHTPALWTKCSPSEVGSWLLCEAMTVPSRKGHGWSDGWRPAHGFDRNEGEFETDRDWVWAHNFGGDDADLAQDRLMTEVRDIYGIDIPGGDEIPVDLVSEINEKLDRIVNDIRRGM